MATIILETTGSQHPREPLAALDRMNKSLFLLIVKLV